MKKKFSDHIYCQSRRNFILNGSKLCIGLAFSGLPINSFAYEELTPNQLKNYVLNKFLELKQEYTLQRFIDDIKLAKVPFDYTFTRSIIERDFHLRWHIAYTMSDLAEDQLLEMLYGGRGFLLNLSEQHSINKDHNFNLINTIKENKISIKPKPSEIRPMENIQIPVGNNLKDKYTCRDIIIQIIIEAVTGVKIVKDQISKLSSDFIDIIDCVLKATKEKNWDKLEYCIIQLSVLLFSPKFIKIFKEILGDNAFKKFLKFSTTRFIPIVGTAFFVTELIFAIKNNWDNLQYYCYQ